jgi:3-hydroxyisobutyrate dehydrogenase-like beta-hydroxyacid dehydrogenase
MHLPEVGIIGCGLLGSAMAQRLIATGFNVIAHDCDAAAQRNVQRHGALVAASNEDVARRVSHLMLSLPHSKIGAEVIDEIAPVPESGAVVIDTTTGDPNEIQGFGERLTKQCVQYLDATIGGNSKQVLERDVIVLVGGSVEAYASCSSIFDALSRQVFHLGDCGAGARMKLVLNLVLGLNRAVLAEGLTLAAAYGFDLDRTLEILRSGPAWSRVMDLKGHKMIASEFSPDARLSQHLKDVRLILEEAARLDAAVPLSTVHRELLQQAEHAGFGERDNSAVIQAYRK